MTIFLLLTLGVGIWYKGGMAFSPGRLSQKGRPDISWQGFKSHAEFETQCSLCHAPLKVEQRELCAQCHTDIAQQLANHSGTHSLIPDVNHCATCHPDHRGVDFDLISSAFPVFNHENTVFSLKLHQVNFRAIPIHCADCHSINTDFSVTVSNCVDCHATESPDFIRQHVLEFGENCLICHDGQDRFSNFDHHNTGFSLEGKHRSVACQECHHLNPADISQDRTQAARLNLAPSLPSAPQKPGDPFKNTPTECASCHKEPTVHAGVFSQSCETCHTTQGWLPANLDGNSFNHAADTGFSLIYHQHDYDNRLITCMDCHSRDFKDFDGQICINCHQKGETQAAFLQQHQERYSPVCLECHDGADRMQAFDHADYFPLDGKHAELDCLQCHVAKKFASTPAECSQCHLEPGIHVGFFGLKCQYCHTAQAWSPAKLHAHIFPLNHGGQGEVACEVCHPGKYAEYTCYGCHDHQPETIVSSHQSLGVSETELLDCAVCHPNGLRQSTP